MTLRQAQEKARREYRSLGLRRAYLHGFAAAKAGRSLDSCPYRRRSPGWGRVWRSTWQRGYRDGT